MSNTNRPAAPTDCDHSERCTGCGCSECGALVDRETLRPLTLPSGQVGWACPACLADGEAVPVAVEEEQTVKERTPTDTELLALREAV